MQVDGEPAGKGPAGKRSAPKFQRQVMDQMECYRRYPMTGPVALDLHFRAARKNPPTVQRAAKHTLDILGAALPGCERPRRRSVLYHDDRQVKFLYADLVASFVSCDRGCLPVLTALSMSEPGPVFAGSDRSHGAEVHRHRRERQALAKVSASPRAVARCGQN
jgi:hypothetical protein